MEGTTLGRRLTAILAADVVGYSRLMGEDQVHALAALRQVRKDLFEPLVKSHNGSIVKSMGDGWLVEFQSVSDAVNCAISVADELNVQEIIRLRTGVHIGEVVFEEEDIFGDLIKTSILFATLLMLVKGLYN